MTTENMEEADWQAINMLTDQFSLCQEHTLNLLEFASGDQVIVESVLLVARKLGGTPYESARQYLQDILQLSTTNKKT